MATVYVVIREWDRDIDEPQVFKTYHAAQKCQTALINEMKQYYCKEEGCPPSEIWVDSSQPKQKIVETDQYGVVGVVYIHKVELQD